MISTKEAPQSQISFGKLYLEALYAASSIGDWTLPPYNLFADGRKSSCVIIEGKGRSFPFNEARNTACFNRLFCGGISTFLTATIARLSMAFATQKPTKKKSHSVDFRDFCYTDLTWAPPTWTPPKSPRSYKTTYSREGLVGGPAKAHRHGA